MGQVFSQKKIVDYQKNYIDHLTKRIHQEIDHYLGTIAFIRVGELEHFMYKDSLREFFHRKRFQNDEKHAETELLVDEDGVFIVVKIRYKNTALI